MNYTIENEHGETVSEGFQTAEAATRRAQALADRTNRTLYVLGDLRTVQIDPGAWRIYPVTADGSPVGGERDFFAAGEVNRFATEAAALEAASSLAETCPVEGGRWAVTQA